MSKQQIERIPEFINFPSQEEKILTFWRELNVFKSCLKQSNNKPRFSFYDGPPFATGLPHYGHILAGTIKDIVTRYAHQQGYHVERRFGWDCHGLPIEFEIDKTFNIKGPEDVMKMGIGKYNEECRKIVSRNSKVWKSIIERLGRLIDFENDYKTMYPWYMESIWWVFKELYNKGLVYQGVKVMPYSTACHTPLSNFESGQNYKDVVDPAIVISFPMSDDNDNTSLLAWTTTPWTLPSNLSLCVNPNLLYVKIYEKKSGHFYILMETRIQYIFNQTEYEIVDTFPGSDLENIKYEPLFPYFKSQSEMGAFKVLCDDYVTADSGTGIVHQAPYFGEDDYRVCLEARIISKDQEPICPVDANGRFTDQVIDFKGEYVKDADINIVKFLESNGRLIQNSQIKHSYPFCWRSDTPLIYKAVPSWFIRVEHMVDNLIQNSNNTYWVPEFVRNKRFGNWLREARDWAVSRNRYWGTPIPLWVSTDGEEILCVGSIKELEELTKTNITDLHRENIDHLEIPSKRSGQPNLRRISEVFDCWFESGSMPYAQQHYPFENSEEFENNFPADFIAEGIDQTRGWFYTLIVISTALFGKPPFKNLIANGLVLASDGQKMSKRKKNYPDPMEIVNKYGADALRLYLINSPVVRAENLKFKEQGVKDIIKDVFLPWFNAFRFFIQNIECYNQETNKIFLYDESELGKGNIMDQWILSFTQSLLEYVRSEMKQYHLYTVVPRLTKFIDHLTNWYVRMNRKRLKGTRGYDDAKTALMTLFNVLFNVVKIMAPFTPFLSEYMYQHLRKLTTENSPNSESVHYLMLPICDKSMIDKNIERIVSRMQSIIELGRVLRDRKTIPVKYPLPEVVVIHHDQQYIDDVYSLENYILSELNVKKLTVTKDKKKFGVTMRAEPDHKILGARLKNNFKMVTQEIQTLTDDDIKEFMIQGWRDISGQRIEVSEVRLIYEVNTMDNKEDQTERNTKYEAHHDNNVLVLLDITQDITMQEEGTAREIINRIQKLRKKAQLVPTDQIIVYYKVQGNLERIVESHKSFIESNIKAQFTSLAEMSKHCIITDKILKLKDSYLYLMIAKPTKINLNWVNVQLFNLKSKYCFGETKGTILLKSQDGFVSIESIRRDILVLFGLYRVNFDLYCNREKLTTDCSLSVIGGKVISVWPEDVTPTIHPKNCLPFCMPVSRHKK